MAPARVRLRFRGYPEIMEQHVAALTQQVMEMSERLRQGEEAAEQARQLLEAHRRARQILEERMNRAEAAATAETLSAGRIRPGSVLCCAHLVSFWNEQVFRRIWVFVSSRKVGRRFWPFGEKLRGDVTLIWHPLLFRFFRTTDVPALVRCHFVDAEQRPLRVKS